MTFTPDETLRLAVAGPRPLARAARQDGWRYGNVRDAREKVTPQMVPWDELKPEWREYNLTRIKGDARDPGAGRLRGRSRVSFFASSRRRWYLLAGSWVVLIVLGYGGFVEQARDAGEDPRSLDTLYSTLQLAPLEYGGDGDNWRLEVARFAAPLMATGTLVQAASVVFRDQFMRMRLRRFRRHTVVCGLGASGTRLALALAAEGRRVVGVDPDGSGPGITALRAHDLPCLPGDPTDPAVLKAVRSTARPASCPSARPMR